MNVGVSISEAEMGHTDTEAFLLDDKELAADLAHDRHGTCI